MNIPWLIIMNNGYIMDDGYIKKMVINYQQIINGYMVIKNNKWLSKWQNLMENIMLIINGYQHIMN